MQGDGHDGDHTMGDEDAQGSDVDPNEEHYTSFSTNGPHVHAEHPLVNGDGHADAPSGSQEHSEGGAASATSQNHSNQNSQETVPSTPPAHTPGANALSGDASSSAALSAQSGSQHADASQVASAVTRAGVTPLQAMDSMASTVPDTNQELAQTSPYASTVIDGGDSGEHQDYEATQPATQLGGEHTPGAEGPPLGESAAANLLGEKIPSANRLSVSYAGATRRLVIDAEVVPKLKVFRAEGRIEVTISLIADERGGFKGVAVSIFRCHRSSGIELLMPFLRWRAVQKKARTSLSS